MYQHLLFNKTIQPKDGEAIALSTASREKFSIASTLSQPSWRRGQFVELCNTFSGSFTCIYYTSRLGNEVTLSQTFPGVKKSDKRSFVTP
ncbi:hypothetical protein T06_11553 [Trichinella sp. T6]|nr:hypothetical protein T06_11553 [Trichinella sp. T6]